MPSRAFGDTRYKWPTRTLEVVLPHIYGPRRGIPRNYKTPPYVVLKLCIISATKPTSL